MQWKCGFSRLCKPMKTHEQTYITNDSWQLLTTYNFNKYEMQSPLITKSDYVDDKKYLSRSECTFTIKWKSAQLSDEL